MKRFTWQEMQKYWDAHSSRYAKLDYDRDPDGLGNVCYPWAPLWLNQYYALIQRIVYQKLFFLLPQPMPSARALDVGCGAGRWCRFLAVQRYNTVGIDLQSELIEINRHHYPNIRFLYTSIQDYSTKEPFDLVSSVTVIQHIPFEEQDIVIQKLRQLLKVNGYAIVLENIHDQGPHVFSNTIKEWQDKFENAGFYCVAIRRYDYSPFIRFYSWIKKRLISILWRRHLEGFTPETFMAPCFANSKDSTTGLKNSLRLLNNSVKRFAVGLDTMVEPIFIHSNIAIPTVHCGFLFKAF